MSLSVGSKWILWASWSSHYGAAASPGPDQEVVIPFACHNNNSRKSDTLFSSLLLTRAYISIQSDTDTTHCCRLPATLLATLMHEKDTTTQLLSVVVVAVVSRVALSGPSLPVGLSYCCDLRGGDDANGLPSPRLRPKQANDNHN